MPRFHLLGALCGAGLALSCPLAAQADTLKISGRVAVGVDAVNHIDDSDSSGDSSATVVRGGGNNWGTSMLTVQGDHLIDQLPGNTHAIFMLESGFDAVEGELNDDKILNRRAYAGLSSDEWGTVIIGRNLSQSINTWYIDPFYQQFMSSPTLVRNRNWQSVGNMVGYRTPNWNGWAAEVQFGLGGDTGSFNAERKDAAELDYISDRFEFRTIYDDRRDAQGQYSDLFLYSRELTTGAVVHLDRWDLYAGYNGLWAPDDTQEHADHGWVGAHYKMTPRWQLQGAVYHINVSDGGGNATLYVAGTTYDLSKDFFVYATVGSVSNSDKADFSVEVTDDRPTAGNSQQGTYLGMVYKFGGSFHRD